MAVNSVASTLDSITRMKTYFYDREADLRITFSGGEVIKVNKVLLAFHIASLDEIFSKDPSKDEFFVPDFDSITFKLFLDCLMGFKPYTDLDSLLIFPIAHKYQSEKSLRKCIKALKPKTMSETVCHTLNLALYYEIQDLTDSLIDFLKEEFGIRLLLEAEHYCSILEPLSMAKLLEYEGLDSSLLNNVCDWAKNSMKNVKKPPSLVSFLKEHKILDAVQECKFESFQSIIGLRETEETKGLVTAEQICSFFKDKIAIEDPRRFPNKSTWVTVKKGEKLKESCVFAKPLAFRSDSDIQMTLQVWINETIFMDKAAAKHDPAIWQLTLGYDYNQWCDDNFYVNEIHTTSSFNENNLIKKDGKYIYEILSPVKTNFISLQSFDITYTFNENCKILKTSMEGILINGSKTLCYTYCITGK